MAQHILDLSDADEKNFALFFRPGVSTPLDLIRQDFIDGNIVPGALFIKRQNVTDSDKEEIATLERQNAAEVIALIEDKYSKIPPK